MDNVLVLDSSYTLVNVTNWKRAITLVLSNKAEVLEEKEATIKTVRVEIKIPVLIRLIDCIVGKKMREITYNRKHLFERDNYTCQYCGHVFPHQKLTIDHVLPRAQGGQESWLNSVAACMPCNFKKGNRTPEKAGMRLLKQPKEPNLCLYSVEFGVESVEMMESVKKYLAPYVKVRFRID